ncbi:MAG: protein kinase, partial [Myxococcales bacterium]|nr:protein kinase [Myxococcales bacterium]
MQRGDLVAGRFLVEDIAGEGGMSVVFRARDEQSGGAVALKFLRGATRQADRVRFDREARILSELRHPGIVSYVAHGQAMGGRYLAMEWLEGCTLTQRLRRSDLPWSDAIAIVRQAAATLGAAHARGVVHRDVKPSNLFLVDGRPDRVKVLDFGVAIAASSLVRATHTGLAIGTPAYMSPEQARGLRDLDARSDVFALGSVLFECLAARRAFDGDSALAILGKIALEPSPRLADVLEGVPPELDELVAAMLAKPREERPADGRAVAEALAALPSSAGVGRRAEARATEQLTASEQRLLSVVLARGVVDDDETSTFVPGGAPLSTSPLDPLREVARAFEARLDIIADDTALLTISGASGAANDQAAQAARCALALRRVLAHAPIAVATGRAVITGRSPLGEVIDRAASLLAGDRDAIVLDAVTAGLLGDRFELATDGSDARLLLLRERDSARGGRRLLGRPVQCVGRDRELVTLAALYDECAAEPLAQAVLVTGPSGAGKSTLRDELVARLAESDTPPQVLIGRGDPIAARSPYALLAGALRRTAAMREDEPLEARRVKLRTRVARNVRDTDVERVSTFLGEIVSTPMLDDDTTAPWAEQLASARQNPALMGDQIRRAFEDFIEAECSAQPTLLVLDDLHWGDLPSVQLVDRALRRAEDLPLMVLAIARPDVHDAFPQLWKMRGLHEIRLGGLHRRHCAQLVRRALGEGVDDETVARVVERSAGNPFFLEELIRALADGRGADLPETVLAMLQARLERIEPEARLVLRAGSVFGRVFWRGGVDRLLGSGDDKTLPVSDWLAVLCERELIEQHATSRFRPHDEQQFAFRHALLRDAAYAMLTERDRQLGHRLAGTWLAEAGETDAVVLAEHFERGDNRERARLELGRAAQEALRAGDFSEALAHVARATKLEPAAEQRGRLALVAAEALRWQ